MKKIFVLFLCLLCLSMPSVAKTKNKRKQSQKTTAQSPAAKQKAPASSEDKTSAELQRFQEKAKRKATNFLREQAQLKILSWDQFDQKAKETPNYIKNLNSSVSIPNRYGNIKTENPNEPILNNGILNQAVGKAIWAAGEPDWVALLNDNKFLFLGETFFGSASSLQAVKSAVRNLRKASPNTRILLATEFVQNTSLNANLLYKAGQNNPNLREKYPLFSFADEQNIDILALDELIFDVIKGKPVIKADNQYIEIPYETDQGKQVLVDTIAGKSLQGMNSLLFVERIIKHSFYGIRSANEQWAQRIKNVQNQYDIILVYVSDDHLLMDATSLLKNLINSLKNPKVSLSPVVILSPAASQVPAAAQAEYNDLLKTIETFQFVELQNQLIEEMGKSNDQKVQNMYLWNIMAIQDEIDQHNLLIDLFSFANLIRSLHAFVTVVLNDPSTSANPQEVSNTFTHPFWVELSSSQEIVEQISKQQGITASVTCEPEGRIIFYHVGEAQAAEYIQMSLPSATK